MSVSGNVAEQRSHLSSETISITANNAEPVLFHACWGRSSVGTAPRAPHLCAPVTSSDVPPALASASCSGHQLSPARREHRALVAGTAGFSGVGLCEPSCLPQEEDQLGGLTYFLAFPVEVEAGTGDWVEAATT